MKRTLEVSKTRSKVEKLTKLLPDMKRTLKVPRERALREPGINSSKTTSDEVFVFTENQLRFHALFTLAEALSRDDKYSLAAEIFSVAIKNGDSAGTSVFDIKLLNQSRYKLSVLYIMRMKSNYDLAVSGLRKIDSITASTYSEYELCMAIALFKEIHPSTVLIPSVRPSDDVLTSFKEPLKHLDAYLQKESPKNYIVAWRLNATIFQVIYDFKGAENIWKKILKECEDNGSRDQTSYSDEACLSLARIYAEVPEMMDKEAFTSMFSKVSDEARTGDNETLYWYVSTIAAVTPWLKNRDESSLKKVEETLAHIEKQSIGGIDFFRAIVEQKKGDFDGAIEKLVGISSGFSYWGGFALVRLSEIYLAAVTNAVSVEVKTTNLDLAEKYLLLLSKRSEEDFRVISNDGLQKVRIARAALKNIGDMSIEDLISALKLEQESSRRIPLVLALFEKYSENSQRSLGMEVLNEEIKREPDSSDLRKCRALSDSREIKDIVKMQDDPLYDKTLSELIEAEQTSIKCGSDARELEEEFLRLVIPAYSDVAVTWLGRFLQISPLNEKFLDLLSVKSEEVGTYDVLVTSRMRAVKEAPENAGLLTGLAEAQFEKGREEFSSDKKEEGSRTFDQVLKTCRLIRDHNGSTVYEKANSFILEGKVYRQLIIHNSQADATKKSITAYKRAYESLKDQSDYQANKLVLMAATDLSEIYFRAEAPLEQRKYLQVTVKALEELLKDLVSHHQNGSVTSVDEKELADYSSRYEQAITNLAWNVYSTENFESAVKVIGKAVKNLPEGNITLALLLGSFQMKVRPFPETSLGQTEFADLAGILRAAVSSDPSEKRLRSLLAAALIRAGQYEDGLTELNRVESLVEKLAGDKHVANDFQDSLLDFNHEAIILRSEALLGMTLYDEMIKELSEMEVPSKTSNRWSRCRLIALAAYGRDGSESEKFKESMALVNLEFLEIKDPSLTIKCQYADLMLMNGNSSAVVDLFVGEKSLSNAGRYRLALARFLDKDYSEAENLFAEVARSLEENRSPAVGSGIPKIHVAYRFAALSALGTGSEGLAGEYFGEVFKTAPDDSWSTYFQGKIHFSRNRWVEAQQYGDKMYSSLNDNYSAVFLGALIALEGGRLDVADLRIDRAIKLAPQRAEPYLLKGLVTFRLTSNRDKSVEFILEASKLDPQWTIPFEELAWLYVVDQPELALNWFEKVTASGAELSSRGFLGRGMALKNMGKGMEALTPLFYALADKILRPQVATLVGEILTEAKEPALANKWLALAATKDSGNSTESGLSGADVSEGVDGPDVADVSEGVDAPDVADVSEGVDSPDKTGSGVSLTGTDVTTKVGE
jgi:tetratricopeptide (TPR) repeat protein